MSGVFWKRNVQAQRHGRWVARVATVSLYVVTLVVSAALAVWVSRLVFSTPPASGDGLSRRISDPREGGEQIVLVFIGSTSCVWSSTPGVRDGLRQAAVLLHRRAEEEQIGFHRIGVAVSPSTETGAALLADVGEFDEIVLGGHWTNVGLLKYVVYDFPGAELTPQVLVLRRSIGANGWGVRDERVLRRLVGTAMISNWVAAGGVLPASGG